MSDFFITKNNLEDIQYFEEVLTNFFLIIMILILVLWLKLLSTSFSINSLLQKALKLKNYMNRVLDERITINNY